MSFVPPLFSKFGKGSNDVLSKTYAYVSSLTYENQGASGITVKSSGKFKEPVVGSVKASFEDETRSFELVVGTVGDVCLNGKLKGVSEGVDAEMSVNVGESLTGSMEATYKAESVAATCVLNSDKSVSSSAVIGFDGLAVGGQVDYDSTKQDFTDFNLGFQYSQSDSTFTLRTKKKGDVVNASYYQKVNSDYQVGCSYVFAPYNSKACMQKVLTIGSQYKLDKSTTLKTKLDTSGVIAASLQHKIPSPNVKVTVSGAFTKKSLDTFSADKFGICLAMGDF